MARKAYCPYHGPWNGFPNGVEMKHYWADAPFGGKIVHWYECPVCDNGAPAADTEEGAWLNAVRLYLPQQPLTVDQLDDPDIIEGALWLEYVAHPLRCVHVIDVQEQWVRMQAFDWALSWSLDKKDYGSMWRMWLRKPTDDDIADAPWEGGDNE